MEALVRCAALLVLLSLPACKGCGGRPGPAGEVLDCGATRGAEDLQVVRAAPGYPSPRACLLARYQACAPARLQHLDERLGKSDFSEVVPGPKGCAVTWSQQSGDPRPVVCTHLEAVHKVLPDSSAPASAASDRLLLGDCSDHSKHLL